MSCLLEINGRYYYQWRERGKTRQKALKTTDKKTAQRLQIMWDQRHEQIASGMMPRVYKIEAAILAHIERKRATLAPRSLVWYAAMARRWIEFLTAAGVLNIAELQHGRLTDYVEHRKPDAAPKTIWEELILLKSVLRQAVQDGLIGASPVTQWPTIRHAPAQREKVSHYTIEEITLLRKHFSGHPFEAVLIVAIFTGARRDELHRLRVSDVDLPGGIVRLHTKKTETTAEDQQRYISIHPDLLPVLSARVVGAKHDAMILPELLTHSRNWPHTQMQEACRALGIQYRRFHGLRHAFATYLLAGGVDIRQAMAALGHSRLETTQRYAHLSRRVADTGKLGY